MLESGNESTLRLLYYPPLGAPAPGLARCGAHCDYGTFTLLAQVKIYKFIKFIKFNNKMNITMIMISINYILFHLQILAN